MGFETSSWLENVAMTGGAGELGEFDDIGHDRYGDRRRRRTWTTPDLSIQHRIEANPEYAELPEAEIRRQRLIQRLVAERKANGLTQAAVAKAMRVGQSVVAEIESAKGDIRYSTLDRSPPPCRIVGSGSSSSATEPASSGARLDAGEGFPP
ncbi:MAG: helix-turn-helix transcriptional regulator [Acidimicrobiia bacterium]|nr:helix-turn-helix transcriptional regulator [Acidimicrobiia bacterium]